MSTTNRISKLIVAMILISNQAISAHQEDITGSWTGIFMDQFNIVLQFNSLGNGEYTGQVKMYDGSTQIQDDKLSAIKLNSGDLSFFIPAKQTTFNGLADFDQLKIEGEFIFPDGSKYPLMVVKKSDLNNVAAKQDGNCFDKKYSTAQLKSDIVNLKENLEGSHPQLYLYTSKKTIDSLFDSAIMALDHDLSAAEFYTLIAPLVAKIRCSHTGIKLSEACQMAREKSGNYLPLKVFVSEDKAWNISAYHGAKTIDKGSEILSINGVPMAKIIHSLMSFIPSEGNNITSKYYELNKNFSTRYNLIDDSDSFQIDYVKPEGHMMSSLSISAESYDVVFNSKEKSCDPFHVQFSIQEDNKAALLEITSFGIQDINWYLSFMDSIFNQINRQKIPNLILDLRGNSGGHPIFAAILYSYLSNQDFVYFKENPEIVEFEPLYKPMQASNNYFSGTCYVLVDGGCLSTTGHLISLLKYHRRAIFIGEEPGSWFYCNDNSKKIKLPNTGIELAIPQSTFETAIEGYKKGDPFIVDHPVRISINHLTSERDVYIYVVKKLLINSSNQL